MSMNNMHRIRIVGESVGATLLAIAILVSIPAMAEDDRAVQEIEIQEYQGEKLGSVDDFRENSIRGVQRIDVADYELMIDGEPPRVFRRVLYVSPATMAGASCLW